jgi:multiple sugar transport system permease protein
MKAKPQKKLYSNTFWNRNKTALMFLSPWYIGLLVFSMIPMAVSLYLSFTTYDMYRSPSWIGIGNYTNMFSDVRYLKSLEVTFTYVFIGVPLQLLFALALALMLNRGIKGLSVFRAVYYVPSLLGGSVAIALLWRQVFGSEGVFNKFIALFGIEGKSWITNPDTAIYSLILLMVWQFGSPMIIFLAGLKQIPMDLYESASIDGAGSISKFFKITIPLLTPIIFFNMVMQIISAFQAFTPAYIVGGGGGGILDSTLFYTLYLYIQAFQHSNMGYASAMAWALLFIIASFTALLFVSSRKWVYYES